MHGIMHVNVKSSEMKELQAIMSKGNTLLKECAEMMDMTSKNFRGKLFDKKLDISMLTTEQQQKLQDAIPHIMEVRNKCEVKIINGFTKAVYKQAKAAASNTTDPYNSFFDFEQVATLSVLDCIYGYTNTKIQFITYVWSSIRHNINKCINRLNPFCPLTNEALHLIHEFEETRIKLNRAANTEEVVEAMGLTEDQKKILFSATTKVINQSHEENIEDYTSIRRGIDNDCPEIFGGRDSMRQAVKDADLSDIEFNLLMGEMCPYVGWREDIASKFINPHTGKRYTREVTGILDRAKRKIAKAIKTPSSPPKGNEVVDKVFDEMSGKSL